MKFALLALALSAIATQAASYDKVDAVVPEELVEDPAPAARICNKHTCEAFWTRAAVRCHKAKDVKGCHTAAWERCVRMNGGLINADCCGKEGSCDHLSTCTKQSCEAFWTRAAVRCHKAKDVAKCHTAAWIRCDKMHGKGKAHCCGKEGSCDHLPSQDLAKKTTAKKAPAKTQQPRRPLPRRPLPRRLRLRLPESA